MSVDTMSIDSTSDGTTSLNLEKINLSVDEVLEKVKPCALKLMVDVEKRIKLEIVRAYVWQLISSPDGQEYLDDIVKVLPLLEDFKPQGLARTQTEISLIDRTFLQHVKKEDTEGQSVGKTNDNIDASVGAIISQKPHLLEAVLKEQSNLIVLAYVLYLVATAHDSCRERLSLCNHFFGSNKFIDDIGNELGQNLTCLVSPPESRGPKVKLNYSYLERSARIWFTKKLGHYGAHLKEPRRRRRF